MQKFWIQSISVAAIVVVTLTYNITVNRRTNSEIQAKEAYEATIQTTESYKYKDGVYNGEAEGFGGLIKVEVTINSGKIEKIDVLSHDDEDEAYYNLAQSVIDDILDSQSTDVDVASGATFSSNGIINAVKNALEKAGN
jgi:uncharacterized protein with FMN-binding domain